MTATTTEPPETAGVTPGGSGGLSPRQRRRVALGVQYALFVVTVIVVVAVIDWGEIREHFFDADAVDGMFPELITVALRNTLIYTLLAYVAGFVLGLVIALMRLSSVAPYRWVALVYIEIFRGVPALLVMLMVGFGIPVAFGGIDFPGDVYGKVAIALGLVAAAYMAETFRAGIQAVPKGQLEAARSLGMSHSRAMVSIIIPQALRIIIPPLTNEAVMLCKDSSLVYVLGISLSTYEITKFGSAQAIDVADSTPYIVAGATYLIITIPLGIVVRRLEKKQARAR